MLRPPSVFLAPALEHGEQSNEKEDDNQHGRKLHQHGRLTVGEYRSAGVNAKGRC
jgi:hypothetical protein